MTTPPETRTSDQPVIEREVRIAAPPEVVFTYLVEPERIASWMGRSVAFEARPGGSWRIDYNGTDVAAGTVLEVEPPHRLVYTWGWEAPHEVVQPGGSTVEFTLVPDGDGTVLRLRHVGLPQSEVAGHAQGWDQFLPALVGTAGG